MTSSSVGGAAHNPVVMITFKEPTEPEVADESKTDTAARENKEG